MPDYRAMYFELFRAHSAVLEILEKAGQKAEEIYISSPEPIELIIQGDGTGRE